MAEWQRPSGLHVIGRYERTFADEYQGRDINLSPSEATTAREAARYLGLRLSTPPTGRTVQVMLSHAQSLALRRYSEATNETERRDWYNAYVSAKRALGKVMNN